MYMAFNSSFSIIPPRHLTTIQVKIKRSLSEGWIIWNETWYKSQWNLMQKSMELGTKNNGAG